MTQFSLHFPRLQHILATVTLLNSSHVYMAQSFSMSCKSTATTQISVKSAGFHPVNGIYHAQSATSIPAGFDRTCRNMNWDTEQMWKNLSDQKTAWFEQSDNESYIYWNRGDGKWWMDGPSGAGVYIVPDPNLVVGNGLPPTSGWVALSSDFNPVPEVKVLEQT